MNKYSHYMKNQLQINIIFRDYDNFMNDTDYLQYQINLLKFTNQVQINVFKK